MAFIQKYKVLTTIDEFNVDNIVFDKPKDEEVGGNKNIKGKRIKIGIMKDGKVAELIVPTEKLYSHKGVLPTKPFGKEDTDEIIGYNIPIALYSRDDSLNGRDRKFVKVFRNVIDKTKDHVVSVKKSIGQPHLVKELLYKWDNILYEKKDESGEPANDFGPTLYAKLMYSKERNQIATRLVDMKGKQLDLEEVVNKPCSIITCIKFESVYINSNGCSLQVKLTEAILDIKAADNKQNLLLEAFLTPSSGGDEEVSDDTVLGDTGKSDEEEDEVVVNPLPVHEESDEEEVEVDGVVEVEEGEGEGIVLSDDNQQDNPEEEVQPKKKATKRIVKK